MVRNLSELLDIAKSNKEKLDLFKRGIYLEGKLGKPIDTLKIDACIARWSLANRFLQYAKQARKEHPNQSRLVIARSYYSMYHAARAVVFIRTGGDDHEAHSVLPQHLPGDFPNLQSWQNKLRTARLERNRADYDPYPKTEKAFAMEALSTFGDATLFSVEAKAYLISKGIAL